MITATQYFREKTHSAAHASFAVGLLEKVNTLLHSSAECGVYDYWIDPDTNSQISGAKGGHGDGGYRLPDSTTGAKGSAHRYAKAVDVYDPERELAAWCVMNQHELDKLGLYMEDPRWTPGWCHLQTVPPGSGKRIYIPSSAAPLADALPGQKPIPFKVKT
jgi:hypothetical protein